MRTSDRPYIYKVAVVRGRAFDTRARQRRLILLLRQQSLAEDRITFIQSPNITHFMYDRPKYKGRVDRHQIKLDAFLFMLGNKVPGSTFGEGFGSTIFLDIGCFGALFFNDLRRGGVPVCFFESVGSAGYRIGGLGGEDSGDRRCDDDTFYFGSVGKN